MRAAANCRQFQMDGTFKIVPRMFYQLFTIFMERDDHVFPIVFALMTGKTPGLLSAIQRVLPNVRNQRCYFHYCQALWRKVQSLGLVVDYKNLPSVRTVVKKTMALPFLPAEA
uniref:MULE transposase domain-containing protein n=1 Tax=Strigamia maritima TaxID=126957 RepID=T1IR57_STRMM